MKTILCATDFTEASITAGKYAKSLASAFNARLILFHAYQPIPTPAETLTSLTPANVRGHASGKVVDQARLLDSGGMPYCYAECEEGEVVDTILSKVRSENADLIVIGMKMEHKGFRKVFGSTVSALYMRSPVPVLVVPEAAEFRDVKSIALAFEKDVEESVDSHLLDVLREIAERFHPTVYVVKVFDDSLVNEMKFHHKPYRLIKMLRTTDPVFDSLDGNDVVEELLQYKETRNLDMLAVIVQKARRVEKLLSKSVTKQLAFSTHIPLLIVPKPKAFRHSQQENEE